METVTLLVNGKSVEAEVSSDLTLLRFLRDHLNLTGTKDGCSEGHCGACTVIVDGKAVLACKVTMAELEGRRVETIEGLTGNNGELHPLQQAFIDEGAVQCGFCTPGMVMAAKALLNKKPRPAVGEIKHGLARNLCRCTGYTSIVRAVQRAAALLAGEDVPSPSVMPVSGSEVIGVPVSRVDGPARASGKIQYIDDVRLENGLIGKVLWSSYPHADILSLDTSAAEAMPGVGCVLTARDVQGRNRFGQKIPDQPALAEDRVRCISDAVAVVFASTREAAEAAVKQIRVEYRELPGVFSPREALAPGAPRIHGGGNVLAEYRLRKGDVERGFAEASVIVEDTYYTPFGEHAFLEPEGAAAAPDGEGGAILWSCSQNPNNDRNMISQATGVDQDRIRVVQLPIGGGFGGRSANATLLILTMLAALKTGKPVKIVLTRRESLRYHAKRHAFYMRFKTGASADGRITAVEADITSDTGAYACSGTGVLEYAATHACGPYLVPNLKVDSRCVYTNNLLGGALRGYGVGQVTFAMESQMDAMARKLGIDPIEFRLKNALEDGSATGAGQIMQPGTVALKQTLLEARKALPAARPEASGPGKRIGVGIASGWRGVGGGLTDDALSGAKVRLTPNGRVLVQTGATDIGQGSDTVMRQIAAQAAGVDFGLIDMLSGDTFLCPYGSNVSASRHTLLTGGAVLRASREFRKMLLDYVGERFDVPAEAIALRGDTLVDTRGERMLTSLAELGRAAEAEGTNLGAEHFFGHPKTYHLSEDVDAVIAAGGRDHFSAYGFSTCVAIVEVHEKTGNVKVLKLISANDIGKPLNPLNVDGQIRGSLVHGLGHALFEEFIVENGFNVTNSLAKYHIPRISDEPEMVPIVVNHADPIGPFGAKGAGEPPIIPVPPAITNAIYDAVGVRITQLPANKARVAQALSKEWVTYK